MRTTTEKREQYYAPKDYAMATRFSLLVVSDSEELARTLSGLLSGAGYDPAYTLVDTPVELSMALAEEPWDVVVTAADCPGLPWEDVLALARATRNTMSVVLMVPDAAPELAREAIAAGVDDVLAPEDWRTAAAFSRILREGVRRKELARLWDKLRGEERKYRGMIDNSVLGIFQCRPWGEIISANPSFARIFGYGDATDMMREYARNKTRLDILPEDRERMLAQIQTSRLVSGFETQAFRKDGSTFWVSVNARPVLGESGEIAAIEGTVEDITDRKSMELLIIRAKQEWEKTFDNVPDIIAILDHDLRLRRANRALAERLGVHPRDIIGRPCHEVLNLPEVCSFNTSDEEDGDTRQSEELFIPALNGTFLVTFSPFFLNGDEHSNAAGTVMVAHEISRRKQLEGQLRQSHKMEAIGTLAGGIAHDFNNILGVMMGYTEMSLDEVERDTRLHRRLGEVLTAGRRARDLVHQILTFSRQEELDLQPLQLSGVVKETVKLMRASLPSNIRIHTEIEDSGGTIYANLSQMQQVLMNLCTNAAHAMRDKGGVMEVQLVRRHLEAPTAEGFPNLPAGEYMQLSVTDTGYGISPEIMENIFDPFFTTKKPNEGTGMGLALVHGIVNAHNGGISVRSILEEGTRFDILIPVADAVPIRESKAPVHTLTGRGRALIVDDEAPLAEVVGEMVQRLGYEPDVFSDSGNALQHFLTTPDDFSLLITDQTMPGLTGGELARIVLKHRPDMPVILCTGYSEQLSPEEAKSLGIRQYLLKPVLREDLAKALASIAGVAEQS
ncbi:PAS domain S-box protein [Desulfovibrio mangrovi]|uniref:PAS domain S-box protein n=1 Tax=Desulfovibrio mangrovi TaxID=2976983 RepID=UPI0022462C0B|nr:PAS domain S-box protein [Desulfovibrio mangrovi]UZP65911.1 PAS domain S-box protein [Desulfovibrio mangrovi]